MLNVKIKAEDPQNEFKKNNGLGQTSLYTEIFKKC